MLRTKLKLFISVLFPSPNFSSQKPVFIWEQIIEVKCLLGKGMVYLENQIQPGLNILSKNHTNLF